MSKSKRKKKVKAQKTVPQVPENKPTLIKTMDYPRWTWVILFLLPFAIYWPTANYGYVLDDVIVLQENNFVKKGFGGIWDILSTESFQGYFGEQKDLVQGARYRPLSLVSFAMEYGIYGFKPGISHLLNILLYGLSGIVLFQVIRLFRINQSSKWWMGIAFICSLLFIVHPLHVEAVANIKGRDEIMAFLGSFGALYLCLKHVDTGKILHLVSALLVFFFGLLAKENTITFLAVIPLSIFFFRKNSLKKALTWAGLLMIPTLIYLAIRYNVIGYFLNSGVAITDIMNNPFAEMNAGQKYATIFNTLIRYIGLHVVPLQLTHDYYPYHIPITEWSSIYAWGSLTVHIGLLAAAIYGLKDKKVYAYCILFYLATMSIVSNLVVGVGTFMNERFMFTASMGYCLLLAYYLNKYASKKRLKILATAITAVLILGYGIRSGLRVPVWETPLSLNTAASKVSTNSARMNSFMSTALYKSHQASTDRAEKIDLLSRAEVYARKSISIRPSYKNANLMLSGIATEQYKLRADLPKLLASFKEIIRHRPDIKHIRDYLEYLNEQEQHKALLIDFYQDVGNNILLPQNKIDWAMHFLTYGFQLDENNQSIIQGIVKGYEMRGDQTQAAQFRQRLR
jgi:hypothetical protein